MAKKDSLDLDDREKLAEEFDRLGLGGDDFGSVNERARLMGISRNTARAWLSGRRSIRPIVWSWLEMFGLLDEVQREEFRRLRFRRRPGDRGLSEG